MTINTERIKTDLSSLGFIQNCDFETYYCTPENAKIIASSGIDGIHYCTVSEFGDIIFAVSPMNFGDCVHPIARNIEDLIRLLLHTGDIAALEQCYAWDEEQYNAFLADNPPTEEQQKVLNTIRSEFGLEPISDSFSYVKKLQDEFDLSLIQYTEDYYDTEMNPSASEKSAEWTVYYDGGYRTKNAKGQAGEEIVLNRTFCWADEIWHIPSIYCCEEGMVVDFCVEIQPEKIKAFLNKWKTVLADGRNIPHEVYEQIENENPIEKDFGVCLFVNGAELIQELGTSVNHIPESCLPDGERYEADSEEIIRHYGFDESLAWVFHRISFSWGEEKISAIESVKIILERQPEAIQGVRFKNPSVGDVISFIHPVHGTEHRLTVLGYEKQELILNRLQDDKYEYPTHHTAMTYTLEPELSGLNFHVSDCLSNDQPRRKTCENAELRSENNACSVAIIGGTDGPTAIFASAGENDGKHCALSALKFEEADDIEWKTVFREKLIDDEIIELI